MRKTKSQMELLGLAIAVVLILIGTIFVARFFLRNGSSDGRKEFIESTQAANIVDTMLNTNVRQESNCNNLKFKDLIIKCAENSYLDCSTQETETSVCKFLEKELKGKLLELTLGERGIKSKYQFIVYRNNEEMFKIQNYDCLRDSARDRKTSVQYLPTFTPGINAEVRLYVCN